MINVVIVQKRRSSSRRYICGWFDWNQTETVMCSFLKVEGNFFNPIPSSRGSPSELSSPRMRLPIMITLHALLMKRERVDKFPSIFPLNLYRLALYSFHLSYLAIWKYNKLHFLLPFSRTLFIQMVNRIAFACVTISPLYAGNPLTLLQEKTSHSEFNQMGSALGSGRGCCSNLNINWEFQIFFPPPRTTEIYHQSDINLLLKIVCMHKKIWMKCMYEKPWSGWWSFREGMGLVSKAKLNETKGWIWFEKWFLIYLINENDIQKPILFPLEPVMMLLLIQ